LPGPLRRYANRRVHHIKTWNGETDGRITKDWCKDVDRVRFVHDESGRCYLLLETLKADAMGSSSARDGAGSTGNLAMTSFTREDHGSPERLVREADEDSPPSYSHAAGGGEDIVADASFVKPSDQHRDGLLLAPGMVNPFLGIRRMQHSSGGIFENLGVVDLPFSLDIAKKSLTSTVSALYAMMLTVTCLVFVSTEVITEKVPIDYFETKGFYTYLYLLSITFMCYIFFYVLRVKVSGKKTDSSQLELDEFIKRMAQAAGVELTEVEGRPGDSGDVRRLAIQPAGPRSADQAEAGHRPNSQEEMLVKLMTSENEKSHGSMMLRIGAIAFGLGTLIYTGLEFVHFFEIKQSCEHWNILFGINPVLHMLFTFMQMYYLFMHARMNIQKNKIIAKFGLMHMLATNCCIWIRTLVRESVREIVESEEFARSVSEETKKHYGVHTRHNQTQAEIDECEGLDILGDTIENSSVYLFPFIIEYSMIGGHIIYNMWKNVGRRPTFKMIGETETKKDREHQRMDWSSSAIGLFLGLLALVTLTITLILYFALVNQKDFHLIAVLIINVSDTVINGLMVIAIIIGFIQIRNLKFVQSENTHDMLMIISAFGIFLYASYTIIAGYLGIKSLEPVLLVIINGIVELVQVNLQLLFIADLKQKKITGEQKETKPGRQIITFLILCNLGLWITYNFEIQKVNATPDQLQFYGFFPWIIIQRITLPLCVFFRFHSTVVLAELWKSCYIIRKDQTA